MRTLLGAFGTGVATHSLLRNWEAHNGSNPLNVATCLRWMILVLPVTICFVILAYVKPLVPYTMPLSFALESCAILCVVLEGALLFLYFVGGRSADRKFLRDCYRLDDMIYTTKLGGAFERITEAAEKHMVNLAKAVLVTESLDGPSAAETDRSTLKADHQVLLRFDLVQNKWDRYFQLAHEQLDAKVVVGDEPVVVPPT